VVDRPSSIEVWKKDIENWSRCPRLLTTMMTEKCSKGRGLSKAESCAEKTGKADSADGFPPTECGRKGQSFIRKSAFVAQQLTSGFAVRCKAVFCHVFAGARRHLDSERTATDQRNVHCREAAVRPSSSSKLARGAFIFGRCLAVCLQ
jgi:hypothetical protein